MNAIVAHQISMTSREIAELTGKNHAHVLRDMRAMLSQLYSIADDPKLDYLDIQGVTVERDAQTLRTSAIHLDKNHTLTLLTGYDAKARMAVIKRWQVLENQRVIDEHDRKVAHTRFMTAHGYRQICALVDQQHPGDQVGAERAKKAEAELLNIVLVGMPSYEFRIWFDVPKPGAIRDHMAHEQLMALDEIQFLNHALLASGIEITERARILENKIALDHSMCMAWRNEAVELLAYRLESGQYELRPTHPKAAPVFYSNRLKLALSAAEA